jgi:hypothetical protein
MAQKYCLAFFKNVTFITFFSSDVIYSKFLLKPQDRKQVMFLILYEIFQVNFLASYQSVHGRLLSKNSINAVGYK